ncbi:MAG: ABC transporter ATP-binding protein [Burkholderiales bacterium]|nr:ABC transporter ATP-binding protein [Burkholderiales bacterium]OJX04711.1 MAG: ABC transporter ATP-binding protein [Burkholderiales bacterium 70-64]
MLTLEKFGCGYGLVQAVHELDLSARAGEITALLGPNGAGKTSTLMAIAGNVQVQRGRVLLDGDDITRLAPAERTRRGMALAPEGRRIFPDLTVAENLMVGGYLRSAAEARETEQQVMQLFPRLRERYRQRAGLMSGGEQQMLAIGRALMARPKLLMIDELSLGLMPAMVDLCFEAIVELKRQGLAVLLVEQNTHRALAAADRVVVLVSGRKAYEADGEQARRDPAMVDSFLGMTEVA